MFRMRVTHPTQLGVHRTEQPGQLLVTWKQANASTWNLHGDTAQIRVEVTGARGSQERFTSLLSSQVFFEAVAGPGPFEVYVAAVDRGHLISDIAWLEFELANLTKTSDWDRVHRNRHLPLRMIQAHETSPEPPSPVTVDPIPPPVTIHHGAYDDLERHVEGMFHLTRLGTEVTATFTSAGSAADSSTVLLTLPPEFRPAAAEHREVEGWPVVETVWTKNAKQRSRRHLQLDVLQPVRFHLQVDPSGEVHYRDLPAKANGDPLAYMLTMTWSTVPKSTVGDLCTRHPAVQAALRQALAGPGQASTSCGKVTEAELAGVSTLELELGLGHAPLRRKDLAGLHGLRQLTFDVMEYQFLYWPSDLLAGVPRLESLHLTLVEDNLEDPWMDSYSITFPFIEVSRALRNTLPTLALAGKTREEEERRKKGGHSSRKLQSMLGHTPSLRALTVEGDFNRLVPDLLMHTPGLQTFVLRGTFFKLPAELLEPVRHLQLLTLESPIFGVLPPDLLAHATELQILSLRFRDYFKYNPYLRVDWPEGFLQGAPALQELHLSSGVTIILTPDFLDHSPWLESLTLDVNYISGNVPPPDLPDDILIQTPRLHTLAFGLDSSRYINWRHHAPRLRNLSMVVSSAQALSPDLLRTTPRLQALTLVVPELEELPPDLLRTTPLLHTLTLVVPALEELPSDLLLYTPQLRVLNLRSYALGSLPDNFLRHTPMLQALSLNLDSLQEMPASFLYSTPELRTLSLRSLDLTELPYRWLSRVPELQSLDIGRGFRSFPSDLLTHTPQLESLVVENVLSLEVASLLPYLPLLQSLHLKTRFHREPGDSLKHTPVLTALTSRKGGENLVEYLPAHTPALQELALHISTCGPTPRLQHLPNLQFLDLSVSCDSELAPNWLSHVPQVQNLKLAIQVESGDDFPPNFLLHAPQLQNLTLTPVQAWLDMVSTQDRVQFTLPKDLLLRAPALRQVTSERSLLVRPPRPRWSFQESGTKPR